MKDNIDKLSQLAPVWARWLAQDASGAWWAYEHEPNQSHDGWYENEVGRYQWLNQDPPNHNWMLTLRQVHP